jgi:hypothetical protein
MTVLEQADAVISTARCQSLQQIIPAVLTTTSTEYGFTDNDG